MFNDAFVGVRWHMHRLRLGALVALINWLLYRLLLPFVREREYENPAQIGYLSALWVPVLGCVAFRRLNGTLLFRW